jgi:hypothetical protein
MAIQLLAANSASSIAYGSPTDISNLKRMSASAWIRPFSGGGSGLGRIISKEPGYVLYLGGTPAGSAVQFAIYRTGGAFNFTTDSNLLTVSSTAPWQHVAATWDGNFLSTSIKIYINGISRSIIETTPISSGTQVNDSANIFCIGNRQIASTNNRAFDGQIAEAAVWNDVLSPEEILSLSKGYASRFVAPHALKFYCPLIRSLSPVNDTASPSLTSVTIAEHPPIIL